MRLPIAAGTLYLSDKNMLKSWLEKGLSIDKGIKFNSISSLFVPNGKHSDLEELYFNAYSNLLNVPSSTTFIILSNNKLKIGKPVSASQMDWFMSFGKMRIDCELNESIKKHSSFIEFDESPHQYDSSIECQLPFLNFISEKSKIVAITLSIGNKNITNDVANAIDKAVSLTGRNVILIGASQFMHCKTYEEGESKLKRYIEILDKYNEFDVEELVDLFSQEECIVNSSVFLIPFVYSMKKGFRPKVLSYKIMKTGVKEEVDVYISLAYVK
jgi:AmmeMemoRadiSam system protein B